MEPLESRRCPFPHKLLSSGGFWAAAGLAGLLIYRRTSSMPTTVARSGRAQRLRAFYATAKAAAITTPGLVSPTGSALTWWCLNDGIMGGKSSSTAAVDANGRLSFSGTISTHGGGFVSARGGPISVTSGVAAIAVTTSGGGGQTVKLTLHTASALEPRGARRRSPMWSAPFVCPAARTTTVLPLADFKPTWRGQPLSVEEAGVLADPAVLSGVESVGIMLSYVRGPNREQFGEGKHPFALTLDGLEWRLLKQLANISAL